MQLDLEKAIVSGVGLLLVGMITWLITTVNSMETEVKLISYKLQEAEHELGAINLTSPDHNAGGRVTCPICLHMKMGYE